MHDDDDDGDDDDGACVANSLFVILLYIVKTVDISIAFFIRTVNISNRQLHRPFSSHRFIILHVFSLKKSYRDVRLNDIHREKTQLNVFQLVV